MTKSRQRGGTFLGLVVGAIIGLAVALAVAIYVAKVPVPFLNKGATRTNHQDAAEAERNRDWDPNAALRGRGAANAPAPVGGSVAPLPEPMPIPTPATATTEPEAPAVRATPVPAEVARPQVAPPAAPAPSADPLGDLAAARSGLPPPVVAPDPFAYFVQAGAFRGAAEADAQAYCGNRRGCDVIVTFNDGCGAVAWNDSRWHGGHGRTLGEAEDSALQLNDGGAIQAWVCTDGHG